MTNNGRLISQAVLWPSSTNSFPGKKRGICKKKMFASAPKSEPSNIFLTCSFLWLGSIFPASELTDAVCMWAFYWRTQWESTSLRSQISRLDPRHSVNIFFLWATAPFRPASHSPAHMKNRRECEPDCPACWPFIYLRKQMDWERGAGLVGERKRKRSRSEPQRRSQSEGVWDRADLTACWDPQKAFALPHS